MLRAAAAGAAVLRKPDPRDSRWWLALDITLSDVLRGLELQALVHEMQENVAILGGMWASSLVPAESIRKIEEKGDALDQRLRRLLFPWRKPVDAKQEAVKALSNQWENVYGAVDDPETQAKIARTVAVLEARRIQPKKRG